MKLAHAGGIDWQLIRIGRLKKNAGDENITNSFMELGQVPRWVNVSINQINMVDYALTGIGRGGSLQISILPNQMTMVAQRHNAIVGISVEPLVVIEGLRPAAQLKFTPNLLIHVF